MVLFPKSGRSSKFCSNLRDFLILLFLLFNLRDFLILIFILLFFAFACLLLLFSPFPFFFFFVFVFSSFTSISIGIESVFVPLVVGMMVMVLFPKSGRSSKFC